MTCMMKKPPNSMPMVASRRMAESQAASELSLSTLPPLSHQYPPLSISALSITVVVIEPLPGPSLSTVPARHSWPGRSPAHRVRGGRLRVAVGLKNGTAVPIGEEGQDGAGGDDGDHRPGEGPGMQSVHEGVPGGVAGRPGEAGGQVLADAERRGHRLLRRRDGASGQAKPREVAADPGLENRVHHRANDRDPENTPDLAGGVVDRRPGAEPGV